MIAQSAAGGVVSRWSLVVKTGCAVVFGQRRTTNEQRLDGGSETWAAQRPAGRQAVPPSPVSHIAESSHKPLDSSQTKVPRPNEPGNSERHILHRHRAQYR